MEKNIKNILLAARNRWPVIYTGILFVSAWVVRRSTLRKIKGKGNTVVSRGAFLKSCVIDVRGNNNQIKIAPECVLRRVKFFIRGDGHIIEIGPRVRINRSALLWCEDENGSLTIGEGTSIEEAHIAVTEPGSRIEIGSGCIFAYDIEVRCGDSHSILDALTKKRINPPADVIIGDRVWIGMGAKILKGVGIGPDSIVATGSVVTKPVPAGTIAAGNPAKIVREGVCWDYQRLQDCY